MRSKLCAITARTPKSRVPLAAQSREEPVPYSCPARITNGVFVSAYFIAASKIDGSSRDWAAKGTFLLGVKAVVAASFERIHRSNLVGMGVLPLQFPEGTTAQSLGLDGSEIFSIIGLSDTIKPGQTATLEIEGTGKEKRSVAVKVRIDTPIEIDYYRHGGILPFVLRQLLSR